MGLYFLQRVSTPTYMLNLNDGIDPLIKDGLSKVNSALAKSKLPVGILAVTKGQGIERVLLSYKLGLRSFGENYLQEALTKIPLLPKDTDWHFIGKIQKNKLRLITKYFNYIESVADSETAIKINRYSGELNKITNVLLQLSQSSLRTGFKEDEIINVSTKLNKMDAIRIKGIMVMPDGGLTDTELVNKFDNAYIIYKQMKKLIPQVECLSMGMSSDFHLAIESGSTQIRLGTTLYGARK
jgi:pyridoxal phosphate enzyme (YggS family)